MVGIRLWPGIVGLLALVVTACSGAELRDFQATFPPSSDGRVDALAVSLVDQTGLVTEMRLAVAGATEMRVVAEPGDASAIRIEWLGNDCDGRTTLVFGGGAGASAEDATYLISLHIDPRLSGGFGCDSLDLPRAITMILRQPVAPDRITISQQFP